MEERVLYIIKNIIRKGHKVTLKSRLHEDLNIDTVDMLMIIADLEEEFSTTIADNEFDDAVTVNDVVEKLIDRGITDLTGQPIF